MAVNPDIADALRDISDRIGDDFESSVASFQYVPTPPVEPDEPDEEPASRIWRVLVGAAVAAVAVIGAVVAAPIVLDYLESEEAAPTLALFEETDAEPTQQFLVDGDTMYLEGTVPSQDVSDVLESAAVEAVGRDRVVNNFEISADAVYDPTQPIRLSAAEPVLFRTGAARVNEQYRPLIALAVDLMLAEPEATLSVTGHTDDVGSEESNLLLSINRAEAVAQRIAEFGIERDRITVDGKGESEPLESNETPEGRAINRRVEFSIFGAFGG